MPAPFKRITLEQFSELLERFQFTRRINAVHMHHTWRPDHQQFKGHASIEGMWNYHTKHNKWSDIAQHITIDPQGAIWLGRNWNTPPASASGQNGNKLAGPFMFEMIGDFDKGRDPFAGEQKKTTLSVIAMIQKQFNLAPGSLMFHNMMSGKTCPGSSIDYQKTVEEVTKIVATLPARGQRGRDAPFPSDMQETRAVIYEAMEDLNRIPPDQMDPADAEPCAEKHDNHFTGDYADAAAGFRADVRGPALAPAQLQALRAHVINLTMGEFSDDGEWKTSKGDVDAIFDEHLEQAFSRAKAAGKPLRMVVQAHGGLTDEMAGLAVAHKSVDWWIANGVYPLYFVWETGAFETIGQLLRRSRDGLARDLPRDIFDYTTDPLIQEAARALQGPRIWGGMKLSAQLASAADTLAPDVNKPGKRKGGAYYVAERLGAFCKKHGSDVQVHAVGHSAGSVFHAYFIPRALEHGVKRFCSVHFMAPAIRVDMFKAMLMDRIGKDKGIDEITLYTMRKDYETDDHCARVYRKSLLYLIYHALEPQRKTPILGLEECLRADPGLMDLFGLRGNVSKGQVVWSRTTAQQGRSASMSTTHGGFDDDGPTMGSVVRRVLGKADADRIEEYVTGSSGSRGADVWESEIDVHPHAHPSSDGYGTSGHGSNGHATNGNGASKAKPQPATASHHGFGANRGRRRALCVGINRYPQAPLAGCVADVERWSASLERLGFTDIVTLLDEQATRAAMIQRLEALTQSSEAGDVIVFQFSGHGTQLKDVDSDEAGGDTPDLDEALCPIDYATGAFLIDDDIGRIFNTLPRGVNLTCFIDCCHSGTVSRFGMGVNPGSTVHGRKENMRFIVPSNAMEEAHRHFRANVAPKKASSRGSVLMREVVFSACMSHEVAWESNGQGEFTLVATEVLDGLKAPVTNAQFAKEVTKKFGTAPRQQPRLYTSKELTNAILLEPAAATPVYSDFADAAPGPGSDSFIVNGLKQLIERWERT